MSSKSTRQTVEQGITALQAGKYAEALKLLDKAIEEDSKNGELYGLRAIAFAQLGRAEAATESFQKACTLDPSAKTFYNLAVHQHNIGEKAAALETAQRCLKLDNDNLEAKLLIATMSAESEQVQFSAKGVRLDPTLLARKRRYGFGRKHLFAVLAENQEPWVALGWTIVGFSIVAAILMKLYFPLVAPKHPDPKNPLLGYKPGSSFSSFALIAYFLTTILASMIWTSLDLIDRRGRALWMIPMMLCCFLFLPFIPQSLYLYAGRRDNS